MSHHLNSVKEGFMGDFIQGVAIWAIKGDTRSLDHNSDVAFWLPVWD